jgi:hypothetical protein
MATRTIPNEGIQRSLQNALISFLVFGLSAGLAFGLFGGLFGRLVDMMGGGLFTMLVIAPANWLSHGWVGRLGGGLFDGLFFGLIFGLFFGLNKGGSAYLKHYVLRFLLWRNGCAPWKYVRFLDYAAERVFLRKVGGGYIFTHRLLMEYFATLQPADQAGQTKTE